MTRIDYFAISSYRSFRECKNWGPRLWVIRKEILHFNFFVMCKNNIVPIFPHGWTIFPHGWTIYWEAIPWL